MAVDFVDLWNTLCLQRDEIQRELTDVEAEIRKARAEIAPLENRRDALKHALHHLHAAVSATGSANALVAPLHEEKEVKDDTADNPRVLEAQNASEAPR